MIQVREKIKVEIDRINSLDVIRSVDEPTEWVSNITYVYKPAGSLRICLDSKDLNKAPKLGHHLTPTDEELTHLCPALKFSVSQMPHLGTGAFLWMRKVNCWQLSTV